MPKSASAATKALAEAVALERAKSGPVSMCKSCGVAATQSGAVKCTVCGATDFEVISQEMIERIAAAEGGLEEETTYDGRKLAGARGLRHWPKRSRSSGLGPRVDVPIVRRRGHPERRRQVHVCGSTDFEVISQEMIEKIAAAEGGLEEETTYDGRKLRWSEDARKGLWTMKNAYQRRRVKARVEKRARMMKLDAITLEFARQVIEEETGTPLEIKAPSPAPIGAGDAGEPGRHGAAGEAKLIARDDKKNPLISTFEWTNEAAQRILRVPAGFMRNKTQERIEELARERAAAATAIDLGARRGRHRDRQEDHGRDDRDLPDSGQGRAAAAPTPIAHDASPARARLRKPKAKLKWSRPATAAATSTR